MPGLDRTGPEGRGPMTGKGMGYCTNFNPKSWFGRGRGGRRGRRGGGRRFFRRLFGFGRGQFFGRNIEE